MVLGNDMRDCYLPVEGGSFITKVAKMEAQMNGDWYWTGKVKSNCFGLWHQYRNKKTHCTKWVYVGTGS